MDKYLVIKSATETEWAFRLKEAMAIGATVFVAKETYEWLNAISTVVNERFVKACDNIIDHLGNR